MPIHANDGCANDWDLMHLMQLTISNAGLIVVEATATERHGRISHGCLGLYNDACEAALARVMAAARNVAPPGTCWGIQINRAGRKASTSGVRGGWTTTVTIADQRSVAARLPS